MSIPLLRAWIFDFHFRLFSWFLQKSVSAVMAESTIRKGFLYVGPERLSEALNSSNFSKFFKRRFMVLKRLPDGTHCLEEHRDDKRLDQQRDCIFLGKKLWSLNAISSGILCLLLLLFWLLFETVLNMNIGIFSLIDGQSVKMLFTWCQFIIIDCTEIFLKRSFAFYGRVHFVRHVGAMQLWWLRDSYYSGTP